MSVPLLLALEAEIVKGDLTDIHDVHRVIGVSTRLYFGISVSPSYLEATANVAAMAKHQGIALLLNTSQMTVSQISILK